MSETREARRTAAEARAEERGQRWEENFKKYFEQSERQIASLESKPGAEKLKRRQCVKAAVATMVSRIILLEDKKNRYKSSYEEKRGKLHHAEAELNMWRERAWRAEAELEKRGKPPEPKRALYVRPGERPCWVKLHGLFQFRDGDEAGPTAVIEDSEGQLSEVGPQYLKLEQEKTQAEGRTGRFGEQRPGDWTTIETREYPSRRKGFIEFGPVEQDDDHYCLGVETGSGVGVVMVNEDQLKKMYSIIAKAMARIGGKRAIREARDGDDFPDISRE